MARGAKARGKRIAFGDGDRIIRGPWSEPIFRYNPNIAPPGSEHDPDIEWIAHYTGNRLYNSMAGDRWKWNYDFRPTPGEIFFGSTERHFARAVPKGFVLVEPNVARHKAFTVNKDWGISRYSAVVQKLLQDGHRVVQFSYPGARMLSGVSRMVTPSFRHALAVLSRASLYIGPEGGLHHGAAALDVPAVVIFGGFVPPSVTGYPTHINLTGGAEACGRIKRCPHCESALASISVEEVYSAARDKLNEAGQRLLAS